MSLAMEAAAKSWLLSSEEVPVSLLGCGGTSVPGGTSCQAENTIDHSSPSESGGRTSAAVTPISSWSAGLSRRR